MSTLPKGFRIGTAAAAFRRPDRDDLGLILSDGDAVTAGVFTTNAFKAAPVQVCQERLAASPVVRGILANSGQANACTGAEGLKNCRLTLDMVGKAAGVAGRDLLPLSTGVIGPQLMLDRFERATPQLVASLGSRDEEAFTRAIMTTDAFPKFTSREIALSGGTVRLSGMAKGAGMICPNMATMLAVVLCDAAVDATRWQRMFRHCVSETFNRVTVDGDTSTNDTVLGLANGGSGVAATEADMHLLARALSDVLGKMAYMLVQDGEGATKVLHIQVAGAVNSAEAERIARTVGHSQLVKTAMYGRDANWGRIVAAVGRSGAQVDPNRVRVSLCGVELFRNGQPLPGDHDAATKDLLQQRDITIEIDMGLGHGEYVLLASDLSHDYVTCNADYRT